MLYSEISNMDFKESIKGKVGKLAGIVFDTKDWKINGFVINHGFGKKNKNVISAKDVVRIDADDRFIHLSEDYQETEVPENSHKEKFFSDELLKMKVLSSDGKKVGKLVDFEITDRLKDYWIWKFLVSTGIKSRRLRLPPNEFKIVDRNLVLDKTYEEIFPEEKDEEEKE